jgi:hypothetical protein
MKTLATKIKNAYEVQYTRMSLKKTTTEKIGWHPIVIDSLKYSLRIMVGYDDLIKRLGEAPLEKKSALDQLESLNAMNEDVDRDLLFEEAAEKTMQCADLLYKAYRLAERINHNNSASDECASHLQDVESYDAAINDLIILDDSLNDLSKQCANSKVVQKGSKASRVLLDSVDSCLGELLNDSKEHEYQFQSLYMEEFTTAFGDELDRFRQEDAFESKDVNYLISCIKAGGDVFSSLEKNLFVQHHHPNNVHA